MSKDVVVVVSLERIDTTVDALDILLISTAGKKDAKTYTTLEDLKADWPEGTVIYGQAAAMFGQGKARPTPASLIKKVYVSDIPSLIKDGVISGGMIPKVQCCKDAIRNGVNRVFIHDGRVKHSILLELLSDEGLGTMFVKGD